MTPEKHHPFVRYGNALLSVALMAILRRLLNPLLGDHDIFIAFLPAVMFTSWIGGLGPSLVAMILGILAGIWFFIPPNATWVVRFPVDWTEAILYTASGLMVVVANESQRRAQQRAETSAVEVRHHRDSLAAEVQERARIEEELRRANERFQRAARAVRGVIFEHDIQDNAVYRSPGLLDVVGYTPEEADPTVEWWVSRIHPDDLERTRNFMYGAIAHQDGYSVQYRILHRDRGFRTVWENALVVRDSYGPGVRVVGSMMDITERTQAEEALRQARDELEIRVQERTAQLVHANTALHEEVLERQRTEEALHASESRLAAIIGAAMDAIISLDAEQHIVLCNAAAERMFRCSVAEALGQPINRFIPERFRKEHTKHIRLFGQTGITSRSHTAPGTLFALRADGEEFPMEATISQVEVAGQKIYTAIMRDITARMRAEEALRTSEAQHRRLADTAYEGIWMIDIEAHTTYVNARMAEMLVCAPEEMLGRSKFDFIFEADVSELRQGLQRRLQGIAEQQETRLRCKNGSVLWVLVSSSPIYDHGQYIGALEMFTDITDRKHAEEALYQRVRQQAAVAQLGQHTLASTDLASLLDEAAVLVAQALDVEHCKVLELLSDGSAMLLRAGVGWTEGLVGHAIVGAGSDSQAGYTLRSGGRPVIVEDLRTERRFSGPPLLLDHEVISGMSVVIEGPDRPFGVLGAHTTRRRTFLEDDVHFLQAVANVLASAIERKRSEQVAHDQTATLIATLNTLSTRPELDPFLEQVLAALTEYLHLASATLWFYDGERDALSLHMVCHSGGIILGEQSDHPAASQPLLTCRHPLWSEMIHTRQPLVVDITQNLSIPYREWLLTRDVQSLLLVPMLLGHEVIGWFSLESTECRAYRPEELELAQALTQQVTIAVQLTRLAEQGRQTAVLQERNRMAREIHDTLAQGFTGIAVQLEAAKGILAQEPEEARAHILRAHDLARASLTEARRSVKALRPQVLEESDLHGAFVRIVERMTSGTPIHAQFQVHGEPRFLPSDTEHNLLRIGTEAVTNALKHAQASKIRIMLAYEPSQVRLSIQDNGIGFELSSRADRDGFGLIGLYERAEQISGRLTIVSHPGQGTEVTVTTPTPNNTGSIL